MRFFISVCFLCAGLVLNGCVPLLVGAGVATGYAVSNDSAAGTVPGTYRDVWDITQEVLRAQEAEITEANESKGKVKALLSDDVSVTVKINTIDEETQRIKVSARKCCLPKPEFAQKIFYKIVRELE